MKNFIMGLAIVVAATWIYQSLGQKTNEIVWTPPLSEKYPLINKISKIESLSKGTLLSDLGDTVKITHIISTQRDMLQQELPKAAQNFPDNEAVQKIGILTFEFDMGLIDRNEILIQNHQDENHRKQGKISEELKHVWERHLQENYKTIDTIKAYYPPLGIYAKEQCDMMACTPPYIMITHLWQMAYLLRKTQREEEAVGYLQLGIDNLEHLDGAEKDQMHQDLYTYLGETYLQQERYDEAVEALKKSEPAMVTADISLAGWNNNLASALYKAGYREAALVYWQDAIDFWTMQAGLVQKEEIASIYQKKAKYAKSHYDLMK
jgi:tetratricopeptide (TPR) repeat protein